MVDIGISTRPGSDTASEDKKIFGIKFFPNYSGSFRVGREMSDLRKSTLHNYKTYPSAIQV
jgi:hypothetical protein